MNTILTTAICIMIGAGGEVSLSTDILSEDTNRQIMKKYQESPVPETLTEEQIILKIQRAQPLSAQQVERVRQMSGKLVRQ